MKTTYIYYILFLFIISCNRAPEEISNTENQKFQKIESYLKAVSDTVPGISIAITEGPNIPYCQSFGFKNIQTKEKLTLTNTFHVASISKTFTATAVMQLAEQGKIDIDQPIITYLPYFKLKDERYKTITVKQMLNHTSGMLDISNAEDEKDYEWDKAFSDEGALERYTKSLAVSAMQSTPGETFHYSNIAYDVLGDLIAKVSGVSFEKYIKDNILNPLEMGESSFYYPEIKNGLRTSPHKGNPPLVREIYPYNRMHAPSSTLNSNVLELSHWAIANIYKGKYKGKQIISSVTFSKMTAPTTYVPDFNAEMGLSWFILPYKGYKTILHDGGDIGYRSMLALIPEKELGIVLLSNTDNIDINTVYFKILDILLDETK
nr:serine hydrolase domain-containing protein [uncultured Chryseobacterium sp.]